MAKKAKYTEAETPKDADIDSDPKIQSDKKPAKDRMCGPVCPSPTICKDVFKGECAVEIMAQQADNKPDKAGTKGYAQKGK
jgi:hypothetical protein